MGFRVDGVIIGYSFVVLVLFSVKTYSPDKESEFAMMVYGKKRYGIISGSELTILSETGDNYAYKRESVNSDWMETKYSDKILLAAAPRQPTLRMRSSLLF